MCCYFIFPLQDKKHGGQSGMVSCIAVHPTQLGTYALGSYSRSGMLVFNNHTSETGFGDGFDDLVFFFHLAALINSV